ncbi:McrB family protein [Streptomyces tsukubensis]|uniref:McrB family protein n=1 Tax=Streptomyces tsukubensis TaxID=83656 RepID=UPI0036B62A0C
MLSPDNAMFGTHELITRVTEDTGDAGNLGVVLALLTLGTWATRDDVAEVLRVDPATVMRYARQIQSSASDRIVSNAAQPDSQAQAHVMRREGTLLSQSGRPDPARRVTVEAMREALGTAAPSPPRRAWLVRASDTGPSDLLQDWLNEGYCGVEASRLRVLEPGSGEDAVRLAVEADYTHLAQVALKDKSAEIHLFLNRMREGDLVLTPAREGDQLYLGEVTSGPHFTSDRTVALTRSVRWLNTEAPVDPFEDDIPDGLNGKLGVQLSVVDLTDLADDLAALLPAEVGAPPPPPRRSLHLRGPDARLAVDLHVRPQDLNDWIELLKERPQLVFYGPPGTGKTYLARKLALHLTAGRRERVTLVQFHPSYAYEDFFEGFRPRQGKDGQPGFELVPGPFRRTVENARKDPSSPHVLIIDEINRANLARVFGELYFLLEYRDDIVHLQYGTDDGNGFTLPRNVVIIGTMNTVDRSVARVDAAMRRRFSFVELHPAAEPTSSMLRSWLRSEGLPDTAALLLEELNSRIAERDFQLGPSYFMRRSLYEDPGALARAWRTSILPLLADQEPGDTIDRFALDEILDALGIEEATLLRQAASAVEVPGEDVSGPV